MYESPIEFLFTDIQNQIIKQQDEQIYKAVLHFVPNVNREELLRALKYDRGQYDKGYADGYREGMDNAMKNIAFPKLLVSEPKTSMEELEELMNGSVILSRSNDATITAIYPYMWIPVTERLPEVEDEYLVVVKYKYDHEKEYNVDTDVAMYSPYQGGYIDNCWNTYNDWDEGQQYLHVTHWMPLPEPPKAVTQ